MAARARLPHLPADVDDAQMAEEEQEFDHDGSRPLLNVVAATSTAPLRFRGSTRDPTDAGRLPLTHDGTVPTTVPPFVLADSSVSSAAAPDALAEAKERRPQPVSLTARNLLSLDAANGDPQAVMAVNRRTADEAADAEAQRAREAPVNAADTANGVPGRAAAAPQAADGSCAAGTTEDGDSKMRLKTSVPSPTSPPALSPLDVVKHGALSPKFVWEGPACPGEVAAMEASAAVAVATASAVGDEEAAGRVPVLRPSAAAAGAAAAAAAAASTVDAANPASTAAGGDQLLAAGDFRLLQTRFEEAAIFLAEGENNIKFDMHPHNLRALKHYKLLNSPYLNLFDLLASLLLMALAICEQPSVKSPFGVLPLRLSSAVELICLTAIAVRVICLYRWIGLRRLLRRPGMLIKILALLGMAIEASVVIGRNTGHLRLTRILRPLFVIDNYYSAGARRVLRQIAQSFFPILDMLLLLLFFIFMFAIIGFYTFSSSSVDPNFSTLHDTIISLFVLITTANYPDVMMPSYSKSRWAFIFFLIYLVIGLYFLQNLLLAVVYDTFRDREMDKFKKLYLHKREAIRQAYSLLKDDRFGGVPYANFRGMMRYRSPRRKRLFTRLFFCALNRSETEAINLQEFYNFYETEKLEWKKVDDNQELRSLRRRRRLQGIAKLLAEAQYRVQKVVTHVYFEYLLDVVIVINTIVITYDAAIVTTREADESKYVHNSASDYTFVSVYWLEVAIKVVGLGVVGYFASGWNRFDLFVTILSTAGIFLAVRINIFVSLRQLRILRLFKIKQRFRQVLGTMLSLMPSLGSFVFALVLVFYSFAILGIELFSGKLYKGCCGPYFSDNSTTDRYYLNNFDNIINSYVTLFELMVVNNWYVIMNGHVEVTNRWTRIYFMIFYIVAVNIALNVVVAFILETFLSRMSFERAYDKELADDTTSTTVYLAHAEVQKYFRRQSRSELMALVDNWVKYQGTRKKTMADCQLLIFQDEVREWCKQDEVLRTSMLPVRLGQRGQQAVARPKLTLSQEVAMRQRSSDDDLNAQEMVLVSSIMGDAAHRLPWAMPSQQERMLLKALARPPETRGSSDTSTPLVPQTVHSTHKLYPTLNIPDGHSSQASTGALPPRKRSATFHVESSAPSLHPDVSAETSPASRRSGRVNAPRHFLINVAEEDVGLAAPPLRRSRPAQQAADRSSLDDSSERRTGGLGSSELGNRYEGDESSTSEGSYLEERDSSEGEIEYPTPLNPGRGGRHFGSAMDDADDIRPTAGGVQLRQRRGYHHTSARSRNLTRPSYDLVRDNVLAMSSDDRDALRRLLNDDTN